MARAVALSGAVILKQEGSRLTYKQKCEKCGNLSSSTISCGAPSVGSTLVTSFSCSKCKNSQRVQIKGA
jgi:hypothetical protein